MSILPEPDNLLAVIGGKSISPDATIMGELLGYEILAAGFTLATGGRRGAGEAAARGAVRYCCEHNLNFKQHVFAIVPWGKNSDFLHCRTLHAGKDTFERGMVLMNRCRTVFVIGGGPGTEHEIMHAAVDDYMAWGTANILPVAGTGAAAERILHNGRGYGDPALDDPRPTAEKARLLVKSIARFHFPLFNFWNVDVHDGWLSGSDHPVVRRTYRIRHYREHIRIEGE